MSRVSVPTLNVDAAVRDTVAAVRAGWPLFLPVAAAFVLLPSLLIERFGPPLPRTAAGLTLPIVLIQFVAPTLIGAIAQMTIAALVIEGARGVSATVGATLRRAVRAVPVLAAALLLAGVPVAAGILLLVVPGFYMAARLALVLPIVVMEQLGPVAAVSRSWALTQANGVRVLGFVVLWTVVFLLGSLIAGGLGAALGSVVAVMGSRTAGGLLAAFVGAAAATAIAVVNGAGSGVLYLRLRR